MDSEWVAFNSPKLGESVLAHLVTGERLIVKLYIYHDEQKDTHTVVWRLDERRKNVFYDLSIVKYWKPLPKLNEICLN